MAPKTNKLNIYLIKDNYKKFSDILKVDESGVRQQLVLDSHSTLYYTNSVVNEPDWLIKFFGNRITVQQRKNFKTAGVQAILLIKIPYKKGQRIFALPFGYGRFMLGDYVTEERFGLKTTLNVLHDKSIRNIEKRTLTKNPKLSREQVSRASIAADFDIDIERDLIESITGKSEDVQFGNILTGKDALSVSPQVDITNLSVFLNYCLTKYYSKAYKSKFKWIDQIEHVKDQTEIDVLEDQLVLEINKKSDEVWMAIPSFIDWEKHLGFKYSGKKADELVDEIDLSAWLTEMSAPITRDDLLTKVVTAWAADNEIVARWPVHRCLYAEITTNGKTYFLTDSKWFAIANDFVKQVNNEVTNIKWINLKLPDYNHADENAYNIDVAATLKGEVLDAHNLNYGGGYSKIEFCDVLTHKGYLIHAKKYSGSAPLSHLFNQGYVSAELMLSDKTFRQELQTKILPSSIRNTIPINTIDATNYHIVFVLIAKNCKSGKIELPFFSKVTLRRIYRLLTAYRFTVSLCAVKNVK